MYRMKKPTACDNVSLVFNADQRYCNSDEVKSNDNATIMRRSYCSLENAKGGRQDKFKCSQKATEQKCAVYNT